MDAYILPYPKIESPTPEKLKGNAWLSKLHTLRGDESLLSDLSKSARAIALESGAHVLDVKVPVDGDLERQTTEDGGHRNERGYLIWAAAILKALNAPSDVSSVHLALEDAPRVVSTKNTEITDLKLLGTDKVGLQFKRKDRGLPFISSGFDYRGQNPTIQEATPVDDFTRYTLKVEGLPEGKYSIQAGVGIITAEGGISSRELSNGVNLARMGFNSSELRSPWAGLSLQLQWNSEAKYRLEEMGKDLEWSGLWLPNYKWRREQLDQLIETLSEQGRAFVSPREITFTVQRL